MWNLDLYFQFLDEMLRVHQKFVVQVLMFVGQWTQQISLKRRCEEAEELNFKVKKMPMDINQTVNSLERVQTECSDSCTALKNLDSAVITFKIL